MDFHIFGGRDHHLVKSALFTFSVNLCSHTEDKNYGLITKIKHRKKKKKRKETLCNTYFILPNTQATIWNFIVAIRKRFMKRDCQWKKTTKQKNHNHHRIPRTTLKNVHESPLNHKLSIRSTILCLFIFSIITVFLFSFISFRTLLTKDPNLQSKECRHRI